MSAVRRPIPSVAEVMAAFARPAEVTIKQIRERFGCSYHTGRELRDLVFDIARRSKNTRVAEVMAEHRMSEAEARDFIAFCEGTRC